MTTMSPLKFTACKDGPPPKTKREGGPTQRYRIELNGDASKNKNKAAALGQRLRCKYGLETVVRSGVVYVRCADKG
jgi:hypothetical protein